MKRVSITKILPPTYFYFFIILSIILQLIFPIKQLIFLPWSYLRIIPIGFGTLLNIWADRLFKQHKIAEKPFKTLSSLIISGPFKISIHLIYLGMVMILVGISLIFGSLIVFLILFFLQMKLLFIVYEKNNIGKIFKDVYKIYKKKVRRWV
jgi:protein-S-isoprenylcysteine O-methyltransferase Ste14